MSRIHVLPQAVADRIAAGEVVERPASVVKELLENALDAGATRIVMEVEGAGQRLIRVSDNGTGIHADDLRLAVQRFATSKIAESSDLFAISSLGFRGEALPSIAAVSQMEITSAIPGAPGARRIRVSGGEIEAEQDAGGPEGTVVSVRHLFFNTPARRKFLKSPAREFALIVDAVNRLALAQPAVAFRLLHEGQEVLRYAAGREDDRAAAVLGEGVIRRSLPIQQRAGAMSLRGWLGMPELARPTRRQQYVIVNGRPVHSRLIGGAVEQAYQQIVPAGRFPVYVLFVGLAPHRVDVNVHPRKLEVRFDDDHQIFGTVAHGVREALRAARLIRVVEPTTVPTSGIPATLDLGGPVVSAGGVGQTGVAEPPVAKPEAATTGAAVPGAVRPGVTSPARLPAMRLLGQLHRTYLLAQSESGLIIIDQHAAHERVLYERLLQAREAGGPTGQGLVTPEPLTLGPEEWAVLEAQTDALRALGFALEPFGERTVLIRSIPQIGARGSTSRLLRDLLAEAAEGHRLGASHDLLERLTITTACRTAIRAGDPLTAEQMVRLLQDLAATQDPFTCFHGRPTMVTLTLEQVERWFLRR